MGRSTIGKRFDSPFQERKEDEHKIEEEEEEGEDGCSPFKAFQFFQRFEIKNF